MADVYRFLSDYEGLIYLVLAIGGIVAIRWLWLAWQEWKAAIYGLERQVAQNRLNRALAVAGIIILLMLSEFVIASFVVPSLPSTAFQATPTPNILVTPTGTISAELATSLAATASAILPTPAGSTGCVPNKIEITAPKSGAEVKGTVQLFGVVNVPNLGFYKYEISPQGKDTWSTLFAGEKKDIQEDGSLGFWDTTVLTPGDYQLRLVVTDNQGQAMTPCVISLRVSGQ